MLHQRTLYSQFNIKLIPCEVTGELVSVVLQRQDGICRLDSAKFITTAIFFSYLDLFMLTVEKKKNVERKEGRKSS